MMIKKLIKLLLPKFILNRITDYRYRSFTETIAKKDIEKFIKYTKNNNRSLTRIESRISMACHRLEKGLTMPNRRYGFGVSVVCELVESCNLYIDLNYDTNRVQIKHSIAVLLDYIEIHEKANYILDAELVSSILSLSKKMNITNSINQLEYTPDSYYKYTDSPFDVFSNSRRSVRNYLGKDDVNIDDIIKAVELANNAPSSCNRQTSRVYVIKDKQMVKDVIANQNGNRGFGEFTNKVIVLTADISVYDGVTQRNSPYIDGGMFGMNLLYALHFHKIAACTLNCYLDEGRDRNLRKILNIPESEVFIYILSIGSLPSKFSVVRSVRNDYNNILSVK